uniref:Uncharacterized protein n=1 Tax=Tanacetum cinerariifolium TaxID=118510 RepID=A0A6L2L7G9_TANCI|nr:hypothetical protein [Tanacetum cinerariifolium]GEW79316.1 hypothetical protein [Tanacetum cinerariifolium]
MLLAMKDEARRNLTNKENDFMLDISYGEEIMEEITTTVMLMACIQPANGNVETVPSYDGKAISEVNVSSKVHEQISHEKRKTIIQTSDDDQIDSNIIFDDPYVENIYQTIHMVGKTPNKVFDLFLKVGLGYNNPERLKKVITAQPKMYDGEKLHSAKLVIDSPDSEETLEDAEKSRLKMRNKMVQINHTKLNALYETFVPQQDFSIKQPYFSIPSTFTNVSESKAVTLDLPIPKMPKESKLLKMFDTLGVAINGLRTRIDNNHLEGRQRRGMIDCQNSLREFYKIDNVDEKSSKENILQKEIDRLLEVHLTSEIQNSMLLSVEIQENEMLNAKLEKSLSDSKDIQANLLKKVKILEYDFKRSQAQSIDFELKLQYQKEKMACDVS